MDKKVIIDKIKQLAKILDYEYNNLEFLCQAMRSTLIHTEGDGKNRKNYTNDSLATLGDSILKFTLTESLFFQGKNKGEITEIKKKIENNDTLHKISIESAIINFAYNDLYFYNEAPQQSRVYHSKHDVYIEAIIAAIYLDRGLKYTKKWIKNFLSKFNVYNFK